MRHRRRARRLSRNISERKALLKSLATSLLTHRRIKTSLAKAKEARRIVDALVTLGKKDTLAARRQAYGILNDRDKVKVLFSDIAPLFKNRVGGYTRIIKAYPRRGDGAEMVFLELTERPAEEEKKPKTKKVKEAGEPGKKQPEEIKEPKKPAAEERQKAAPPPPHEKKSKEPRKEERPAKRPPKKGFFKNLRHYLNRKRID